MAGAGAVFIKSGEQPRLFNFGRPDALITSIIANTTSQPLYKESVFATFQAVVKGTGLITATVNIQQTNDDNTGRGFVASGANSPGFLCSTTSGSPTLTCPAGYFTSAMGGALVVGPGVPAGTTATFVNSTTITMSQNATASSPAGGTGILLYDTLWCTTVLGTITLSSTGQSTDGFTTTSPWRYVRAAVTNITGTVTACYVLMGV